MTRNLDSIRAIYQAFGQGDVPAILSRLSPQVQWDAWLNNSAQAAGHPLLVHRTDSLGVGEFFQAVGRQIAIHEFQVLDVFGQGRQVVAEVVIDCTYQSTGRRVRDEELHLWTFNDEGQVVRFRHYLDTAKHMHAAGLLPA